MIQRKYRGFCALAIGFALRKQKYCPAYMRVSQMDRVVKVQVQADATALTAC